MRDKYVSNCDRIKPITGLQPLRNIPAFYANAIHHYPVRKLSNMSRVESCVSPHPLPVKPFHYSRVKGTWTIGRLGRRAFVRICFIVKKKKKERKEKGKNGQILRNVARERDDLHADPVEPDKFYTYFDYQVSSESCCLSIEIRIR